MTEHDDGFGFDDEHDDGFEFEDDPGSAAPAEATSDPGGTNARFSAPGHGTASAGPADPSPLVVWDFTTLTGAAENAAQDALEDWVTEVLDGWYGLVGDDQASGSEYRRLRVPACWAQHGDVRIELGWLAQEWLRCYRHDNGDLHGAAEWHTRYLPAAVERIRKTSTACACSYQHKTLT